MSETKIKYEQLNTGFEFTPSVIKIDEQTVAAYKKAVEIDDPLFKERQIVPPMAIAALAMRAMAERFELLPGTVHTSQQLEFLNTVDIGETLTSLARVNRKIVRGKFHMLNIGIKVVNQKEIPVLTGEIGFILPLS